MFSFSESLLPFLIFTFSTSWFRVQSALIAEGQTSNAKILWWRYDDKASTLFSLFIKALLLFGKKIMLLWGWLLSIVEHSERVLPFLIPRFWSSIVHEGVGQIVDFHTASQKGTIFHGGDCELLLMNQMNLLREIQQQYQI